MIGEIRKGHGAHMSNLHKIASIPYHYSTKLRTSQLPRAILLFFGKITKSHSPKRENRPLTEAVETQFFAWGRMRVRVSMRVRPRERTKASAWASSSGCSNQDGAWASQPRMTLLPTTAASSQKTGVG